MPKAAPSRSLSSTSLNVRAAGAVAWLKRNASAKARADLARYGLPADKALGVPMRLIQKLAKELGRDHELAEAMWKTDIYEARLLVAYIGEAEKLTAKQMDAWCREFDNWGVVDTLCFCLFDRSPLAWKLAPKWAAQPAEFVKRAGFVLFACLAGHDRTATDAAFLKHLPLIERGATDERNFVKKGVSWALRMIGRRSQHLNGAALEVARRLAESDNAASRWIGKAAVKELTSPAVLRRFKR